MRFFSTSKLSTRLLLGTLAIACISLFSVGIGWIVHNDVSSELTQIKNRQIPAITIAHDIVQLNERYRDLIGDIAHVSTHSQLDQWKSSLRSVKHQIENQLDTLDELLGDQFHRNHLDSLFEKFSETLQKQIAVVEDKIDSTADRDRNHRFAEQLMEKVAVYFQIHHEQSQNSLRASAMVAQLSDLRYARSIPAIESLEESFHLRLRHLVRESTNITANHSHAPRFLSDLEELVALSFFENSLFEKFKVVLRHSQEFERLHVRGKEQAMSINQMIESEVVDVRDESISSLQSSVNSTEFALFGIALLGVLSFLVSAYLVWKWVYLGVIARIKALKEAMVELAHGNLEAKINDTWKSHDEISELNDTFRVFRKNAQLVDEQRKELEVKNDELQQLAYIVSHDLRAPLNQLATLVDFIRDDQESKLTKQSSDDLDLMKSRVARLREMLDGLLSYTRVGNRSEQPSEVDVKDLVDQIKDLLPSKRYSVQANIKERSLKTRKTPLDTVLRNLITNAAKHHDSSQGHITVDVDKDCADAVRIAISDDGPGIPEGAEDTIFQPFQRLNSKTTGAGMGLAIVKKIVEQEGGSIEIVKNRPRGTRFILSWPLTGKPL